MDSWLMNLQAPSHGLLQRVGWHNWIIWMCMRVCVCVCGIRVICLYVCKCLYASSENNSILNFGIAVSGHLVWAVGQESSVCCGWSHSNWCLIIRVIPSGGGDWTSTSLSIQVGIPHKHMLATHYSTPQASQVHYFIACVLFARHL